MCRMGGRGRGRSSWKRRSRGHSAVINEDIKLRVRSWDGQPQKCPPSKSKWFPIRLSRDPRTHAFVKAHFLSSSSDKTWPRVGRHFILQQFLGYCVCSFFPKLQGWSLCDLHFTVLPWARCRHAPTRDLDRLSDRQEGGDAGACSVARPYPFHAHNETSR